MDNPMTPRLVELVRALTECADAEAELQTANDTAVDLMRKAATEISRLMAEGGLSKEPLRPLGQEEELTKALTNIAGDLVARGPSGFEDYSSAYARLKHIARSALQANEVKRLSNPVDDGAVERAAKALCDYTCGPSDFNSCCPEPMGQKLCQRRARAALEAAEPHP